MGELFGTLGLAWPRLLIYPGGLSALGLAWLLDWALASSKRRQGEANDTGVPTLQTTQAFDARSFVILSAVVTPLLVISLLPLPYAVDFPYSLDLPVTLALLEWPQCLLLWMTWRAEPPNAAIRQRALLEGYALLLLAALALALATGSLRLNDLPRVWPQEASLFDIAPFLGLAGSLGWSIALLPLLELGPFRSEHTRDALGLGCALRALGHVLLATLPWLTPLASQPWLMPLPPLGLALLLGVAARWGHRLALRCWQIGRTIIMATLITLMIWVAATDLLVAA
ncbi:MAG: hypothetical protein MI924_39330 [Chloroflexales bacterium]|nr:hypothetical protein [Chloroflexales bacterium]